MRISKFLGVVAIAGLGAGTAAALDPNLTPDEALRSGYQAYVAGDAATALEALGFAADNGNLGAMWKLGRMYATGDLVPEDDRRALELFSRVASEYADSTPWDAEAPYVADAYTTLGIYYQRGIPGAVNADQNLARRYFEYSASYFRDADAQYALAMMLLAGEGGEVDARQAARWFKLAARKGHVGAQAEFGHMLYEGIGVGRRPVEGLMWMSIARLSSPGDPLIQARHEQAFSTASEDERRRAMEDAEAWMANNLPHAQAEQTQ
jgi:uncharacterized protein